MRKFQILFTSILLLLALLYNKASAQWTTSTLSTPGASVAVSVGSKVLFAGAAGSTTVDIYDTSNGQWSTAMTTYTATCAATVGTKALFTGGNSKQVDIYDNSTNTWTTATLSQARSYLCATSIGSKVFFAGGYASNTSNVVDIYDDGAKTWSIATLSVARAELSAGSAGTKVFFAGGNSNLVDIYDTSTSQWSTATLSQARGSISVTTVGTKVFFAGGTLSNIASDLVDVFDISTNIWSVSHLSKARYWLAATSIGTKAFFAGGLYDGYAGSSDVVDVYDNSTGTWSVASLAKARYYIAAASNGTKAFFAGGYGSNLVDIYTTSPPVINSLSPASGGVGQTVILSGTNFDRTNNNNVIKFNGTVASVTSTLGSGTSITTSVPAGATSGSITVTVAGKTATSAASFTVSSPTTPVITSFSPTNGAIGTSVVLSGSNFSATPASNVVKFNGTAAVVSAASATSITVTVPVSATTGPVAVTVGGQTAQTAGSFNVSSSSSPSLISFTPATGYAGSSVTLTGVNFDPVGTNNIVSFNGIYTTTGTVTANNSTTIIATVPGGATTGPISVTVGSFTTTSATVFVIGRPPDTSPPTISTYTFQPGSSGYGISANIVDPESGIASAVIRYRPVAGSLPNNFATAVMTSSDGTSYQGSIPNSAFTELGAEYKVQVINGDGLWNSDSLAMNNIRVTTSSLAITSYPSSAAGSDPTNYRLVSIPGNVNNSSYAAIFSVLGPYDNTKWRVLQFFGTSFSDQGNGSARPGVGFWFIAKSFSGSLGTGPSTSVDASSDNPFSVYLDAGWNLIGNPYNFDLAWADILAANSANASSLSSNKNIVVYRGSVINGATVLRKFEGAFIKNTGSVSIPLVFPVAKNASIQGGRVGDQTSEMKNSLDQPDWEIPLSLQVGDQQNNLGGIGMRTDASVDFDHYDDFSLPRFIEYLDITFPRKYLNMTYTKSIVPTSENFVWEFSVQSNMKETNAVVSWDNSFFGNAKEIYLLDVASYRITDMRSATSFTFNKNTSKNFKVVFGNSDFVKKELTPNVPVLLDPYPNPTAANVNIQFALPETATTQRGVIKIYNNMGLEVGTADTPTQSGPGHLTWDSTPQPAGMYFVNLRIGEHSITKKIIKQ